MCVPRRGCVGSAVTHIWLLPQTTLAGAPTFKVDELEIWAVGSWDDDDEEEEVEDAQSGALQTS